MIYVKSQLLSHARILKKHKKDILKNSTLSLIKSFKILSYIRFPTIFLLSKQIWLTFIRGLLMAIMSGEWNTLVGMEQMSQTNQAQKVIS